MRYYHCKLTTSFDYYQSHFTQSYELLTVSTFSDALLLSLFFQMGRSLLFWLAGSDMYKCSKGSNSWRVIDFWVISIAQLMIPQIRTYLLLAKMINVVNPVQSFETRAHLGFFARNPLAALWSLTFRDD